MSPTVCSSCGGAPSRWPDERTSCVIEPTPSAMHICPRLTPGEPTVTTRHRKQRLVRVAAATLLVLLAASCSDADKSTAGDKNSKSESPASTTAAANCPGQPLKFTTMASLTGGPTGSISLSQARMGLDAALAEINGTCS